MPDPTPAYAAALTRALAQIEQVAALIAEEAHAAAHAADLAAITEQAREIVAGWEGKHAAPDSLHVTAEGVEAALIMHARARIDEALRRAARDALARAEAVSQSPTRSVYEGVAAASGLTSSRQALEGLVVGRTAEDRAAHRARVESLRAQSQPSSEVE